MLLRFRASAESIFNALKLLTQAGHSDTALSDDKSEVLVRCDLNGLMVVCHVSSRGMFFDPLGSEALPELLRTYLGLMKGDEDHRNHADYIMELGKLTPGDQRIRLMRSVNSLRG
jgi:hypothetical protein